MFFQFVNRLKGVSVGVKNFSETGFWGGCTVSAMQAYVKSGKI